PTSDGGPPQAIGRRRTPATRRRPPAPLPPGILEDAPEAAEHLVRLRGAILLVDGYNVSHAAWPGTPIQEQRRRLVDALSELAARTGTDVRVVFDGSDTVEPPPVGSVSQLVRVRFSPPDVEADDVLVQEVAAAPVGRPVAVATSDRRLRERCRAEGANVIRSSQLLGLLRLR
ncbi:MAG TPA: NYN domain-containing protein, partial [Acidimicrobiales bacterium]|nr:NYN domain-containing protein [Acidimicrobiales bacterium]